MSFIETLDQLIDQIKRRVADIRSGKVEMIPGQEVLRRPAARLRNGKG